MPGAHFPNSQHDRPHARIYDHHMNHPSWYERSGGAIKLITRFLAMYRNTNPNLFLAGGATVAKLINVDPRTGKKLVDELVEFGFLREERKGRNRGIIKTRERAVSLTRYDTQTSVGDPDLPKKIWKEIQSRQKMYLKDDNSSGSEKSLVSQDP